MIYQEHFMLSGEAHAQHMNKIFLPSMQIQSEIEELEEKVHALKLRKQLLFSEVYFFGVRQNPEEEREIFAEDDFGFKAVIQFKQDSSYEGAIEVMHNLTEVHYLYKTHGEGAGIAFESDIHAGGRTCKMRDIAVVSITRETKIHNELYPL